MINHSNRVAIGQECSPGGCYLRLLIQTLGNLNLVIETTTDTYLDLCNLIIGPNLIDVIKTFALPTFDKTEN